MPSHYSKKSFLDSIKKGIGIGKLGTMLSAKKVAKIKEAGKRQRTRMAGDALIRLQKKIANKKK